MDKFCVGLLTLIYPLLFVAAAIGWVWSIVKIIATDGFSGMLVGRVVGVFVAPLGAVLGYF